MASPKPSSSTRPSESTCSHLLRGAGTTRPPRRRPAQQRVRPTVQRILDSMAGTPAFVLSGRGDILAANHLGRALYSPVFADSVLPPNNIRFVFLNPHATEFFRDWDQVANDCVAMLRAEAGRDLYDRRLTRPGRASSPPAAKSSVAAGPPTTSGSTPPA